ADAATGAAADEARAPPRVRGDGTPLRRPLEPRSVGDPERGRDAGAASVRRDRLGAGTEGGPRLARLALRGAARVMTPRVCVFPSVPELEAAVVRGGGEVSEAANADALVLFQGNNLLDPPLHEGMRWVQSSSAGNDHLIRAGLVDGTRVWTGAAGVYARPISEHVLGLLLVAARNLHAYARARS